MAEQGQRNTVRNMYGRSGKVLEWTERQRAVFKEEELRQHPDVLFKMFIPIHPPNMINLARLVFRPTNPAWWMTLIANEYPALTVRRINCNEIEDPVQGEPDQNETVQGGPVIEINGNVTALQNFCKNFKQNLQRCLNAEIQQQNGRPDLR